MSLLRLDIRRDRSRDLRDPRVRVGGWTGYGVMSRLLAARATALSVLGRTDVLGAVSDAVSCQYSYGEPTSQADSDTGVDLDICCAPPGSAARALAEDVDRALRAGRSAFSC
jgi:hypothetical protein